MKPVGVCARTVCKASTLALVTAASDGKQQRHLRNAVWPDPRPPRHLRGEGTSGRGQTSDLCRQEGNEAGYTAERFKQGGHGHEGHRMETCYVTHAGVARRIGGKRMDNSMIGAGYYTGKFSESVVAHHRHT